MRLFSPLFKPVCLRDGKRLVDQLGSQYILLAPLTGGLFVRVPGRARTHVALDAGIWCLTFRASQVVGTRPPRVRLLAHPEVHKGP